MWWLQSFSVSLCVLLGQETLVLFWGHWRAAQWARAKPNTSLEILCFIRVGKAPLLQMVYELIRTTFLLRHEVPNHWRQEEPQVCVQFLPQLMPPENWLPPGKSLCDISISCWLLLTIIKAMLTTHPSMSSVITVRMFKELSSVTRRWEGPVLGSRKKQMTSIPVSTEHLFKEGKEMVQLLIFLMRWWPVFTESGIARPKNTRPGTIQCIYHFSTRQGNTKWYAP